LTYSFLLLLTSTAVWMVRNQSLMEMWWLFTMLMRYPRDIYTGSLGTPICIIFSFVLPAMLVIHVPASVMARHAFEPETIIALVVSSALMLLVSRWVFRRALASYRSASS